MIEAVNQILQWIGGHPHWSCFAVALVAFMESLAFVGLIVPGALIMFGAGALVASGAMDFWATFTAAVLGAIAGDGVSYWFGRRYGDRLRHLWPFRRHPELLARGEHFFLRHGGKSIVLGRFVGPVRPVIPVVAGILNMPPKRFFAANVLSALAWAPAYLLPGMAFGLALVLAGEVAARLAILLCVVMVIIGIIISLIRSAHRHLLPHLAGWATTLMEWGQRRRVVARLIGDLLDPARQPHRMLLAWLGILIAATWLFLGVLEDVLARDQLVSAGQSVYDFLQQLRTPIGDRVMVALTELGDVAVTVPVIVTVLAWLLLRRAWRDVAYWLAAVGFGVSMMLVFKASLHIPRPVDVASGVSVYSFPSGHATMSTVVYGFLAAFIAPALSSRMRYMVYVLVAILIGSIAFSRLYLGAHWLADVIGGLSLGSAGVALLTIVRRRHGQGAAADRWLGGLVAVAFLLAGGWHIHNQFQEDLGRYAVRHPIHNIRFQDWWQEDWRDMPAYRLDLEGEHEQPLNVQYAGELADLKGCLVKMDWHDPLRLSLRSALRWLVPSPSIDQLPVLPKLHSGRPESLLLVHADGDTMARGDGQLILRLWPTEVRLQPGNLPLWIGYVGQQKVQRLPLLSFPRSAGEYDRPLMILRSALSAETAWTEVKRQPSEVEKGLAWNGTVLLLRR